jgi:predicted peptidase
MSKKIFVLLISFAFILGCYSQAHLFSFEKYKSANGDTLNYRMLYPDYNTVRKLPLVVFLHGSGERGNDNIAQLKWGAQQFASEKMMITYPAFVIAPQCPANDTWSNIVFTPNSRKITLQPTPSKPMKLLLELVQDLSKKFAIDTNRIYITGLSMGGFGTFEAMARMPKMFAAAVPVCGGGDTSKAVTIAHIPTWIFHGAEDASVDPALSLDMLQALTRAGARPGFTQYPEVGHFSWLGAYSDPLMMEWMFRQRKK